MGLNPFRPKKRTNGDYVFVIVGLLVCLALVLWALLG